MIGGWRVSLLLVVLLVAGCHSSAPEVRSILTEALRALSGQRVVVYRAAAGPTLTVTRNGLAEGTVLQRGHPARLVRVGGSLFVRAPAEYWQKRGLGAERATEFGSRWVRADQGEVPDPRPLAPATLARTLRANLPADAEPKRTVAPDGTTILSVHGLEVTAQPPYRVVSIASVLFGQAIAGLFGGTVVTVDTPTGSRLTEPRTAFDDAVAGLGQPFVAGPVVTVTVTGNDLTCAPDGECTDAVSVRHELSGTARNTSVRLVLTAAVDSPVLGAQSCTREVVVAVAQPALLTCSVTYDLPRRTGSATVIARPAVRGDPLATVDTEAMRREVATELGG